MAARNVYDFDKNAYETLVKSNNDMVGKLALALYLMDKLRFIENYKSHHTAKEDKKKEIIKYPDLEDLESYEISIEDELVVDSNRGFRKEAADHLAAFITAVIKEREKEKKGRSWFRRL